MSKWIVFKKDGLEVIRSMTYESDKKELQTGKFGGPSDEPELIDHVQVPDGEDPRNYVPVFVEGHPNKWVKEGESDVFVDPEDETWTFVPETQDHYEAEFNQAAEDAATAEDHASATMIKYDEMNAEVMAEMKKVFGTNRTDSATAYFETWQKMSSNPSLFSGLGLKSDRDLMASDDVTQLFAKDDVLDTDTKIQTYADRLLELADEYAAYRMQRIQQFRDEKAAIEAGS